MNKIGIRVIYSFNPFEYNGAIVKLFWIWIFNLLNQNILIFVGVKHAYSCSSSSRKEDA